jgi:hypothetical protein
MAIERESLRKSLNPRDLFSHRRKLPMKQLIGLHDLSASAHKQKRKSSSCVDLQPISIKIYVKVSPGRCPLKTQNKINPDEELKSRHRSGTVQYHEIKTYYENKYETQK